jgi:hypothetical protein
MDNKSKKFRLITERLKRKLLLNTDKALAEKIGLQPKAFNARKQAGSIPYPEILDLANHYNIDLNWLLTREGSIYKDTIPEPNHQSPGSENEIKIDPDSNGIPTDQSPITELITKTIEILESKTVYSGALSANIQAFHKATTLEQKFHELQADTQTAINKMEGRVTALEAENNKLREQIKNIPRDCGGMVANEN